MKAAQKILLALMSGPLDASQVQKITGVWTIELYLTLFKLERLGAVSSDWAPGPYPRRRLYSLAPNVIGDLGEMEFRPQA